MQKQEEISQPKPVLPQELPPGIPLIPRLFGKGPSELKPQIEPIIPRREQEESTTWLSPTRHYSGWGSDDGPKIAGKFVLTPEGASIHILQIGRKPIGDEEEPKPVIVPIQIPEEFLKVCGIGGKPIYHSMATQPENKLGKIIDPEKTREAGWPVGRDLLEHAFTVTKWDDVKASVPTDWFTPTPGIYADSKKHKYDEAIRVKIAFEFSKAVEALFGPEGRNYYLRRGNLTHLASLRSTWEDRCPESKKFHCDWHEAIASLNSNLHVHRRHLEEMLREDTLPNEIARITYGPTDGANHPMVKTLIKLGINPATRLSICRNIGLDENGETDPLIVKAVDKIHRTLTAVSIYAEHRPATQPGKTKGKKRGSKEKEFLREEIKNQLHLLTEVIDHHKRSKTELRNYRPPEPEPPEAKAEEVQTNGRPLFRIKKVPPKTLEELTETAAIAEKALEVITERVKNKIGWTFLQLGSIWADREKLVRETYGYNDMPAAENRADALERGNSIQDDTLSLVRHIFTDILQTNHSIFRHFEMEDPFGDPVNKKDEKLSEHYHLKVINGGRVELSPKTSVEKLLEMCDKADRYTNEYREQLLEQGLIERKPELFTEFRHVVDQTPLKESLERVDKKQKQFYPGPSALEIKEAFEAQEEGPWKVTVLKTAEELLKEGRKTQMNHCVGGYAPACHSGYTTIVSVHLKNQPVASNLNRSTLELRTNNSGEVYMIQNRARGNKKPAAENTNFVNRLIRKLNQTRRPLLGLEKQDEKRGKRGGHEFDDEMPRIKPPKLDANIFIHARRNPDNTYEALHINGIPGKSKETRELLKAYSTDPKLKPDETVFWLEGSIPQKIEPGMTRYNRITVGSGETATDFEIDKARILRKNPETGKSIFMVASIQGNLANTGCTDIPLFPVKQETDSEETEKGIYFDGERCEVKDMQKSWKIKDFLDKLGQTQPLNKNPKLPGQIRIEGKKTNNPGSRIDIFQ